MLKLNITGNFVAIVSQHNFIVFSYSEQQKKWIFQTVVECTQHVEKSNVNVIQCSAFSPCDQYFGVCIDRNVLIYSTKTWEVLHMTLAERKASSLAFFPISKAFLIADKSGCAVCYSFKNKLGKTDINLGHNSMLTGALITPDEKFIITCDRDEKIRVTNYPNVYNIESYCLGHKMFVSCIQLLPTDNEKIISSSGDGTVRLWDYMTGKQLCYYDCVDFNDNNENSKYIITKIVSCQYSSFSLVAFTQYKSTEIKILKVECNDKNYTMSLLNTIRLNNVPCDISFSNELLVCLSPQKINPLTFWSPKDTDLSECKCVFEEISNYLADHWDSFTKLNENILDDIPILLKREVDNLQEYEQRKKARLLKTGKTS